ncbi:MAG: hypothetical protein KKG00_16975, partial [Bacteroidetes bacterium]|nr:hypothetical protein [Bacteroidota bacterium]
PSRHEELHLLTRTENELTKSSQPVPWQLNYYRGILLWQLDRVSEAKESFMAIGEAPKWAPFYLVKADLFKEQKEIAGQALERARALSPDDWRSVHLLATHYGSVNKNEEALSIIDQKFNQKNLPVYVKYILGQQKARFLVNIGKYRESIQVMKQLTILPNEGAAAAHNLFREGNIRYAVELLKNGKTKDALTYLDQAETWPENLGSGQPYKPDNRLTAALKAYAVDKKETDLKKTVQELPEKEQNMVKILID